MKMLRMFSAAVTDLLFPGCQPCLICGAGINSQGRGGFCSSCKETLFGLEEKLGQCPQCGTFTKKRICSNCLGWERKLLTRVISVAPYEGFYRELIMSMKNRGREEIAGFLGVLMAEKAEASGILSRADMIVPVPLHPLREMERGYNQSRWLSAEIARWGRIPLQNSVLVRVRHDSRQSVLSRWERADNMAGAFECTDESKIKGKTILLVDDIVTTGSTLLACAGALREGGAGSVYGLTWAAGVGK